MDIIEDDIFNTRLVNLEILTVLHNIFIMDTVTLTLIEKVLLGNKLNDFCLDTHFIF